MRSCGEGVRSEEGKERRRLAGERPGIPETGGAHGRRREMWPSWSHDAGTRAGWIGDGGCCEEKFRSVHGRRSRSYWMRLEHCNLHFPRPVDDTRHLSKLVQLELLVEIYSNVEKDI